MTRAVRYEKYMPTEGSPMQYSDSDLENLVPLWQREIPHLVNKPVSGGILRRDMDILGAAVRKNSLGDAGTLAQDVFRAQIIRQGAVE